MPLFRYVCLNSDCRHGFSAIASGGAKTHEECPKCGSAIERDHNPPGSTNFVRIDTGHMTKAVERIDEVERMSHDRAHGKKAP